MKNIFYLTLLVPIVLGFYTPNKSRVKTDTGKPEESKIDDIKKIRVTKLDGSIQPRNLLTITDAEKILGQEALLKDSASTIKNEVLAYNCTFEANSKDQQTGKRGAVYFMFENYNQVASAKKSYGSIKTANENHPGIKVLDNLGDEAYFHSDRENFHLIIVRKNEKIFRIKVNKITNTTSLNEFNLIAKNIANKL